MILKCGNKMVGLPDDTKTCIRADSLGTSTFGNGDLFDLGFTHADLTNNDFIIEVKGTKLEFECQKTLRERLVSSFLIEMNTSRTAAELFLSKANWNYGIAIMRYKMQKESARIPKPCGEIPLDEVRICNLGSMTPEAVNTFVNKYANPSYLDKGKRPEVVTDPCICMDYVRGFGGKCQKCGKWPECACQNGMVGTHDCRLHGDAHEHVPAVPVVRSECESAGPTEVGKAEG